MGAGLFTAPAVDAVDPELAWIALGIGFSVGLGAMIAAVGSAR